MDLISFTVIFVLFVKSFNKLAELLSEFKLLFDVVRVSETFIYDNQHSCFPIDHYVFLGDNQLSRCGGTGVYVYKGLTSLAVGASFTL